MREWLAANYKWVFSGAGVTAIVLFLGLFRWRLKRRPGQSEDAATVRSRVGRDSVASPVAGRDVYQKIYLSQAAPPTKEGSGAVRESVSRTAGESRERVCVAPEVTADYLLELFKKNTSVQAQAITQPYFGKWMRLVAVVTDVNDVTHLKDERRTMVHAAVWRAARRKKTDAARVVLIFSGPWSEKARLLPGGARVKVFGRIADANWEYVEFDDCELE